MLKVEKKMLNLSNAQLINKPNIIQSRAGDRHKNIVNSVPMDLLGLAVQVESEAPSRVGKTVCNQEYFAQEF